MSEELKPKQKKLSEELKPQHFGIFAAPVSEELMYTAEITIFDDNFYEANFEFRQGKSNINFMK